MKNNSSLPRAGVFAKAFRPSLVLASSIASLATIVSVSAADLIIPPSFTLNSDTGTPQYVEGLLEGRIDANNDFTTANPGGATRLDLRMGQTNGGPDWADNRTWVYTGQIFTGAAGIISVAANNDDSDFFRINDAVVLEDTRWDSAVAGVATGLTPNTWVNFEYRVANGGGGAGPSGNNDFIPAAENWNNTTGAVLSQTDEGLSLDAAAYDLGKPAEIADGTPELFRYSTGFAFVDDIKVRGAGGTLTIDGTNPTVIEPSLAFQNGATAATLVVDDGIDSGSAVVHKTLTISGVTSLGRDQAGVSVNGSQATIAGSSDVTLGRIDDGATTGGSLTYGGSGILTLDNATGVASDVSGTTLRATSGTLSLIGSNGAGPVEGLAAPISVTDAVLQVGTRPGGVNATFTNSVAFSGTTPVLRHTSATTDTLNGGVTLASDAALGADITGGRLNVTGGIAGAGATLTKTGGQTLAVAGPVTLGQLNVEGGRLNLDGQVTLPTAPVISGNSTLRLGNAASGVAGNIIGGTGIAVNTGGRLEVVPNSLGTGPSNRADLNGGTIALSGQAALTAGVTLIDGFGDGSAYTFNTNGVGGTFGAENIADGKVPITTAENSQARSVFNSTAQAINQDFIARFTYQDAFGGAGNADGAFFAIQNSTAGATALGASGGGKGFGGIAPSAGVEINIFGTGGINYKTGGATGAVLGTGDVNVKSGNPIDFTLTYAANSSSLGVVLRDTVTNSTYSTSFTADLTNALGGSTTGFVGFTGGTGGENANQFISNFSLTAQSLGNLNFGTEINVAADSTSTIESSGIASLISVGQVNIGGNATTRFTGATPLAIANTTFAAADGNTVFVESGSVNLGRFGATVPGPLSLTKTGAGTLALENVNNNALVAGSNVTINAGRVAAVGRVGASDALGAATVTVNSGGTLRLDSTAATVAPTAAITVNQNGTIEAKGGVTDLRTTPVTFAPYSVQQQAGALLGSVFSGETAAFASGDSINNLLTRTPTATALLSATNGPNNGQLNFGGLYNGDGPFNTFYGVTLDNAFTNVFSGTFTAKDGGANTFKGTIRDDGFAIWLDTDQDGLFQDGERLVYEENCCGVEDATVGPTGSRDLVAGQTYKFAMVLRDTGGGSSIAGRWSSTNFTEDFITPGTQRIGDGTSPFVFNTTARQGGGNILVDTNSKLLMSNISGGAFDINLAGNGASLQLNSGTNVTETLRSGAGTTTLDIAAGASLLVNQFRPDAGTIFTKVGAGTVTLNSTGAPQGGAVAVNGGLAVINASLSGNVTVTHSTVAGIGVIGGTLTGQGGVAPGTALGTAGMLTANSLDPATLTDFVFDFTTKSTRPSYGTPSATGNDVLRLTGDIPFNGVNLTSENRITINLQPNAMVGDQFLGGFYVDLGNIDALNAAVANATFVPSENVNGIQYFTSRFVQDSFDFNGAGQIDGYVLQLTAVVPEPGTWATLMSGMGMLVGLQRFRRRRA